LFLFVNADQKHYPRCVNHYLRSLVEARIDADVHCSEYQEFLRNEIKHYVGEHVPSKNCQYNHIYLSFSCFIDGILPPNYNPASEETSTISTSQSLLLEKPQAPIVAHNSGAHFMLNRFFILLTNCVFKYYHLLNRWRSRASTTAAVLRHPQSRCSS